MNNEIDAFMDLPAEEIAERREVTDAIIKYMREQRANFEKGIKPKKAEGPKKKVTLADLGFQKEPEGPIVSMKRRSW